MIKEEQLHNLLKNNSGLHLIVANEVRQTPFGTITFNMELVNGAVQIDSLNIVKNYRRKYGNKPVIDKDE